MAVLDAVSRLDGHPDVEEIALHARAPGLALHAGRLRQLARARRDGTGAPHRARGQPRPVRDAGGRQPPPPPRRVPALRSGTGRRLRRRRRPVPGPVEHRRVLRRRGGGHVLGPVPRLSIERRERDVILRVDRLQVELPAPSDPDPAAALPQGPGRHPRTSRRPASSPTDPPEEPAVSSPGCTPARSRGRSAPHEKLAAYSHSQARASALITRATRGRCQLAGQRPECRTHGSAASGSSSPAAGGPAPRARPPRGSSRTPRAVTRP